MVFDFFFTFTAQWAFERPMDTFFPKVVRCKYLSFEHCPHKEFDFWKAFYFPKIFPLKPNL